MPNLAPGLNVFLGRGVVCLFFGFWSSVCCAEKAQFAYDLSLSGSMSLLKSGGTSMSTNALPGDLINKRNNPWIKLTNNSKDATLDKFVMSVGNDDYHFSTFTIGNQVGIFDVNVNIIDGGKNLELVFANFNPGETVYVKFQLRPDDASAYMFPDFRSVLFDANGISTTDNSVLTAVFNDPVTQQANTLTGKLPNFQVNGAKLASGCARCMCFPIGGGVLDAFTFSQQNNLDPPIVPEPAGWVLMLLGSAITALGFRRHCSAQRMGIPS